MVKRRMGLIAFLLCLCFCLTPYHAHAASTSDATELVDIDKECDLNIYYRYDETAFSDVDVKLYKIADVSADFKYTLSSSFADLGLILNGIKTNAEWDVIRSTLETYILADKISSLAVATTDDNGQARFEALGTGLYLAIVGKVTQNELNCNFKSALVSLPSLNDDGTCQYQVTVKSKAELLPPVEPDNTIEYKVIKLWKDDEYSDGRPEHIEVEIFRDGESYETIVLKKDNNWSYSWTAKDDGANWTVIERNVPKGYIMTLESRETSFVLTNTLPSDKPRPPATGDTSNMFLYIMLMIASGSLMIVLGFFRKRKHA